MKPVKEFHLVNPSLRVWQGYNPEAKVDCTATALRSAAGWMLLDPIPLSPSALDELLAGEVLAGIVLTSGNHERTAWDFQQRLSTKIYAPVGAKGEVRADVWFQPGETILGAIQTVALAGAAPGETALISEKILVLGDAIIHLDALEVLPDKYCEDRELLLESLGLLCDCDFEIICFAHGLPILREGKRRLKELLAESAPRQ